MRFRIGNNRRAFLGPTAVSSALLIGVLCGSSGFAAGPGRIVAWGITSGGSYDYGQVTDTPSGTDFVAVAVGWYHSLALKSDGSIVGWGYDNHGQASPPAGTDFIAIAGGGLHSLGLKTDGSIVGWGYDGHGQASPPAGTDFVAISAGVGHSIGLKNDGSVVSWGLDGNGQVSETPGDTDFVAIVAGMYFSLGLKTDGSIVGWGSDGSGQATPPAGTDFVAIAAGYAHSLGLKSDGSIVGWGWDLHGEASPPAGTDFVAIAAGGRNSLGLRSDGSMVGWGDSLYGLDTPPAGTDFVAMAVGGGGAGADGHCLALRVPPVPELVNYQGRLNDSLGDPLDGVTVDLTFRFYNEALAGSLFLTVEQTGVQVTDGLFHVVMGSGTVTPGTQSELHAVFQKHGEVWMSTEVGSDGEMTPRKRIGSVGYATRAGSAADLTHIEPKSAAPAHPPKGAVYMDETTNKLMVYDGTTWQACW